MILLEVHYSPGMVAIGVAMCVLSLFYSFGRQIVKERFAKTPPFITDNGTSNKISAHLKKEGYTVCSVIPDGINKWLAAVTKNGKAQVVNISRDGDTIQEQLYF